MTIARRPSPFGELLSLRQAMDRLFEDSFVRPTWGANGTNASSTPIDVSMTADELVVRAALPGVRPEDVDVTVENGTLAIRGEVAAQHEEEEGDFLVHEIRRGTISRSIALPSGLEADRATATFEDGILTLRLPKAEQVKPRQIRITPTTNDTASAGQATPGSAGQAG